MNNQPDKPSFFARAVIVAAAIILLGMGWASVQRPPGPVVSYSSITPPVEVSAVSFDDGRVVEPRICQPDKGVDSACIYE